MELPEILKQMDVLRDELDALRPISDDKLNRLNQKLRLDWNYHSNSMEGNTLSVSETKSFLLYGITAKGKPFRDYVEMRGHNEALKQLERIVHHDLIITETLIKDFHKIILVEPYDSDAEIVPGEYKKLPNYLYTRTEERIDFEPPQEVPRLLNELVNWLNNHIEPPKRKKKKYDLHPLLIACAFHARFVQIHPFGDGNGRMARILMNLILMLCGYVPAIIKLEKRDEYYTALNSSSLEDVTSLAEFVGLECIQSLQLAIKAAKGESIEDDDDLDKKLKLLEQELEAEDEEKEIKIRLSLDLLHSAFDQWGYTLFTELAKTTVKFNKFYDNPVHSLTLALPNNRERVEIEDVIRFEKFEKLFADKFIERQLQTSEVSFFASFGGFKKGGLNPFGCNYNFQIKFEQYSYEVFIAVFDPSSTNGQSFKSYTKRLLHKPLMPDEIKEICKLWGDLLLNHLEYHRGLIKDA